VRQLDFQCVLRSDSPRDGQWAVAVGRFYY
jgi:hypothetical protein